MTYDYDSLKRLTKVYDNGTLIATYVYDANGNRQSLAYNNGVTATYAYNKANMVTSLDNKRGATPVSSYVYTYYLDGNQETKADNIGKITTYVYDGLGRLKSEAEAGIPASITRVYTYDAAGNRVTMAVTGTETYTKSYSYDANNRLMTETTAVDGVISTAQYAYDANGNQLTRTEAGVTETNGYDVFNRLTSAVKDGVTATYAYKADGLRLSKTVDGVKTTHIWDGSNIALDLDGSNAVVDSYIRGINLIKSSNNGYYLCNAHGDVTKLTDTAGAVTKSYEYDAFGVEQGQDENDANPFRYCGEYFDKETDTVYLRNRYYSPALGRFTAEDQIRDGLNWYTYCVNNPIALIDPLGLAPTLKQAALMAQAIYLFNPKEAKLSGGWQFVKFLSSGSENVTMGYFRRLLENDVFEYAVVNKGTAILNTTDWKNNAAAFLGTSDDMHDSVAYAKAFVKEYSKNEITFIGHSKGGGEAIANALSTGRDAITFNPAPVSLGDIKKEFGIIMKNSFMVQSNITNYVVKGEVLNNLFGNIKVGGTVFLPQQYGGGWIDTWQTSVRQRIQNHSMDAVKKAINKKGIGNIPGVIISQPKIG